MKARQFGLAAAATLLAVPAAAQNVRASDPQTIVQALHGAGFKAELGKDGEGDPMIVSASSGSEFRVIFYGCTANKNCATIQFVSGYEVKTPVTLARINEWNKTKRFARAVLDGEGDPIILMDVDLDDGGLSRPLFIDNIEFWASVLGDFERFIGYRK